jgi:hypothetical protein
MIKWHLDRQRRLGASISDAVYDHFVNLTLPFPETELDDRVAQFLQTEYGQWLVTTYGAEEAADRIKADIIADALYQLTRTQASGEVVTQSGRWFNSVWQGWT